MTTPSTFRHARMNVFQNGFQIWKSPHESFINLHSMSVVEPPKPKSQIIEVPKNIFDGASNPFLHA